MRRPTKTQSLFNQPLYFLALGLAAAGAFFLFVFVASEYQLTGDTKTIVQETERIQKIPTTDGIGLAYTIDYPSGTDPVPAVILIHKFGADRSQWDPFVSRFINADLAVLRYDMRGFGQSMLPQQEHDRDTLLRSLSRDLPDVVGYLKQQARIHADRISVVGASVGANVAIVGSGSHLGIYRTVAVSPTLRPGVLDGFGIADFHPSGVYGISDQAEQAALTENMVQVVDPKKVEIVPQAGHGIELLDQPEVINSIIAWISQ